MLGIVPDPYTLRQLLLMSRAKAREAWSHTAAVMALIANCNRDPKKRRQPWSPDDFHPLAKRDRITGPPGPMDPDVKEMLAYAYAGKTRPHKPGLFDKLFGRPTP